MKSAPMEPRPGRRVHALSLISRSLFLHAGRDAVHGLHGDVYGVVEFSCSGTTAHFVPVVQRKTGF